VVLLLMVLLDVFDDYVEMGEDVLLCCGHV
jgi:hypothetical protein